MITRMEQGERYDRVAIALHWTIAALIIFNLLVGFFMEDWPPAVKRLIVSMHISSGLTVLALTALRVIWRLLHQPPPLDPRLRGTEVTAAKLVHGALYAAMVVVPLSGWALISANPPPGSPGAMSAMAAKMVGTNSSVAATPHRAAGANPVPPAPKVWWVFRRPVIGPLQRLGETPEGVKPQRELHDSFVALHSRTAIIMIVLLLLHIGGALKHQLFDGQDKLSRMGIGRSRSKHEPSDQRM